MEDIIQEKIAKLKDLSFYTDSKILKTEKYKEKHPRFINMKFQSNRNKEKNLRSFYRLKKKKNTHTINTHTQAHTHTEAYTHTHTHTHTKD